MGGRISRAWPAILMTAALVVAVFGPSSAAYDEWDCREGEVMAPLPPYDEPAVLVGFKWERDDLVRMAFRAPHPGGPIPGDGTISRGGGCVDGALTVCWETPPLVFTEAKIPGPWNETRAGSYELTAEVAEPCAYPDANRELDLDRLNAVYGHSSFEVTATIAQCDAGGPCELVETITRSVPMPPKGTIYTGNLPPPEYQRTFGSFDWDPATGISNLHVAAPDPVALPEAQTGETQASTGSAPTGGSDSETADYLARLILDLADFGDRGGLTAALTLLLAVGEDVSGAATEPGAAEASERREMSESETADYLASVIVGLADFTNRGGLAAALSFVDMVGNQADAESTDVSETAASQAAAPPGKAPPELTGKQVRQGRVWVSLPASATITDRSKTADRTLKTGVWYQLKLDTDGSQVFYNRKGKLLGTKPGSDTDGVQVQVWAPEASPSSS